MNFKFTKMHGCGNDYVYVNCLQEAVEDEVRAARFVSDRHFGIGADGLILIKASDTADFEMVMYNADGSRSEMCGNGIRCVAKYVYDFGLTDKTEGLAIASMGKVKYIGLSVEDGKAVQARVDMGRPQLIAARIPVLSEKERAVNEEILVDGQAYTMTCVSMGNPHAVVFIDDVDSLPIEIIGPKFENHERFPNRTNTEFARVLDRSTIQMRVWERGTGETLACGTGCCATAVAAILNGQADNRVTLRVLGGDITIEWSGDENDSVFMTGPATTVFSGEITIE
ncbi:MAG: diaminopimelate epimerase [Clostridiales bacterium]|nr:diaminopimelate epimerase [Clostridiales bacterium]